MISVQLPAPMKKFLIDVNFVRGGQVIFRGTGASIFVGVFNGMVSRSPSSDRMPVGSSLEGFNSGYSVSINARGKGGVLLDNLIEAILHRAITPTQNMRAVLTAETNFSGAVAALSKTSQIDENYFIVGGTAPGEGAVISRGRNKADDVWYLNASEPDGWFRLQTNYDHWQPVPVADDRRTLGNELMRQLTPSTVSLDALRKVLTTPPIYNSHTDYTALFCAAKDEYLSNYWIKYEVE